jgi:uncharacterized protein (DUF1778 family)
MPTAPEIKTTSPRLNVRMPKQARAIIDQAASLEGRTTSDFVRMSAVEKAREVIDSHQRIASSCEESIAFARAFLNPSEASDKLRDATADEGGMPR